MSTVSRRDMSPLVGRKSERFVRGLSYALLLIGAGLLCWSLSRSWRGENPASRQVAVQPAAASSQRLITKRIEDIQLGDRIAGRNPLREQAELDEPDPATWRKISLQMSKASGSTLWIELLRPLEWIDENRAAPGNTIYIELHEMGAVGDAEVTAVAPCPAIKPGSGTIVTGTFKHQANANSYVVRLKLEDQTELTGVTSNHAYWSVDRQEFVEVGQLRTDELVDTEQGLKRVLSIESIAYAGFLYNLETTEHVYRVGSLSTLVHNSCFRISKIAPDWSTKGFHVHVGAVEIALRPGKDGTIVLKKVFSSTSDSAFKDASRQMLKALDDVAERAKLHRDAIRARDYLRGLGDPQSLAKAGELNFLAKALEKMGI